MYVGVILAVHLHLVVAVGIPHVCGGDPQALVFNQIHLLVFPMYVGVIPKIRVIDRFDVGIPHVCGGDPRAFHTAFSSEVYSPCMWG